LRIFFWLVYFWLLVHNICFRWFPVHNIESLSFFFIFLIRKNFLSLKRLNRRLLGSFRRFLTLGSVWIFNLAWFDCLNKLSFLSKSFFSLGYNSLVS
jgi:hypothetical protein